MRATILRQRQPGQWYLLFEGIAACNGYGGPIDVRWAGQIAQAFQPPCASPKSTPPGSTTTRFCRDRDAPYCYYHRHVPETGYGYCPHGHGKSLNLHW
jgi:hypothetical protein